MLSFYEEITGERIVSVVCFGDGRSIDLNHSTVGFYVGVRTVRSDSTRKLLRAPMVTY